MIVKQAVVLAAGQSSRFFPFNQDEHKAETVLLGKPIIYWTLRALHQAGVTDLIVVISQSNQKLADLITSYQQEFSKVSVVFQQQSLGQADAIFAARPLLQERFYVLNSYHFFVKEVLEKLADLTTELALTVVPTTQPQHYGVVELRDNLVKKVIEKPQYSLSDPLRIAGVYLLSQQFIDCCVQEAKKISAVNHSDGSHEYLLEETLNQYCQNHEIAVHRLAESLPTLKYAWHLLDLKNLLLKQMPANIHPEARIAKTAQINGSVIIEENALVADFAIIDGPAYLGPNSVVGTYCQVRKGSILEEHAVIQRYVDASDSILMANASMHSGFLGDSILGRNVRIGAGFVSANRRLDRLEIVAYVKGKPVPTGRISLGCILGHDVKVGIQAGTMPNVMIGNKQVIPAGAIQATNLP